MGLLQSVLAGSSKQSRPQQTTRGQTQAANPTQGANNTGQTGSADALTRLNQDLYVNYNKRVNLNQYKSSVGQDTTFVRETLRHKIAEYGLKASTKLTVTKADTGGITLSGHIPTTTQQQISNDLNQNRNFVDAVNRLSVNQPTLNYVDNVVKVSRAYGANNALFDSLLGDQGNGNLQDIAQRYRDLQQTHQPAADTGDAVASGNGNGNGNSNGNGNGFRLTINESA